MGESMAAIQGVTILGSTGTIGVNTLDVISRHLDRFRVEALTANRNWQKLLEQCKQWKPRYAVIGDERHADDLALGLAEHGLDGVDVLSGPLALEEVCQLESVTQVMAGIVGAAGLLPSLAAARAGKRVLLANKEALVMSGDLFKRAVLHHGAELLPIDSEHNAIFQCLPYPHDGALSELGVNRVLLTGSGGPFRTLPLSQLNSVTPEQACAHPNWVMGKKISVDSASMMNKGLEFIEACYLFGTDASVIEIVVHPESVIHSMVSYSDGSVLAQMGNPDMRTPIAHAMAWPDRMAAGVEPLDFHALSGLHFERPDLQRFPCLELAQYAWAEGGSASAVLNAANEVAVQSFLDGKIPFTAIPETIRFALDHRTSALADSLAEVLSADNESRDLSRRYLEDTYKVMNRQDS